MRRFILLCVLVCALFMGVAPAAAQTSETRDIPDLARRLLGWNGEPVFPEPVPAYQVGETTEFWVTKANQESPTRITAELAAQTPGVYLWVEQGIPYSAADLAQTAAALDALFVTLRLRDNVGGIRVQPESRDALDTYSLLRLPDVDNDPHFNILFAADLNRGVIDNPNDSQPAALVPGGYSNQREMLTVNVSAFPGVALSDPAYINILARQYYKRLSRENFPGQDAWLREAFSWYMLLSAQGADLNQADVQTFFAAPDTPLTRLPGAASSGQEFAAAQMFLRYLEQRFGDALLRAWFSQSGDGLTALDRLLAQNNLTDLVTGQPLTARDVFADWVMANALNLPVGDGRFIYALPAAAGENAASAVLNDEFNFELPGLTVSQFGSAYLALTTSQPVDFTLFFSGLATSRRLPIPGDPANRFYWSGSGADRDAVLTRAFDLTGVTGATLTFDVWHVLTQPLNYGYVMVSADGGATWQPLPATSTTTANPSGLAYGAGFTGISNPEPPRAFPYLGVGLDSNGLTITEIVPDGPMAQTEVQAGDTIAGIDGQTWPSQPNLIAFLSNFQPGDVINFFIQRGDEFFEQEVTLGVHPTRVFTPEPLWMEQTVDLNAFAGQQILLRFETIAAADIPDQGMAVDNIAIPEIGYLDDAEAGVQGWTLNGWQQINNEVPQRFLVQAALLKPETAASRVERLIGPGDSALSGQWDFTLQPDQALLLAFSGLSRETTAVAGFTLSAQSAQPPATPSTGA